MESPFWSVTLFTEKLNVREGQGSMRVNWEDYLDEASKLLESEGPKICRDFPALCRACAQEIIAKGMAQAKQEYFDSIDWQEEYD